MGCGASAPAVQETSRTPDVRGVGGGPPKVPPAASADLNTPTANVPLETLQSTKSAGVDGAAPQTAVMQLATGGTKDDEADDDDEDAGAWKVKRRVSRRLSLDVQKRPDSGGLTSSPAWQTEPSAAEQAEWDDAANSGVVGSASVTTYVPPGYSESSGTGRVGMSRLGGATQGADDDVDGRDIGGSWKPKKRGGRRLSLEVDKTPDLALLVALQRSSSAPLSGDYVQQAKRQEAEALRAGIKPIVVQQMASRSDSSKSPSNKSQRGESAVITPGAHSAKLYDFTNSPGAVFEFGNDIDDEDDGSTPVKRRRGRRLSLEVQSPPSGDIVAAVRRTYSAPITAAAAQAAMGAAAWAEVVSGTGGEQLEAPAPVVRQTQTSAQQSRAAAGWGRQVAAPGFGEVDDDGEEADLKVVAEGKEYTRVRGTRDRSRRRSMDIYKRALAEGQSAQAAAAAAGVGTDFTSLEDLLADEEADLMEPTPAANPEYASWQTGGQPRFKKKWADYGDGPQGVSV